jgi:polyphenol oxidase
VRRDDGQDPAILTLAGFGALHGFTTRAGGVSKGPFASRNLGLSSGDDPSAVETNRTRLLAELGFSRERVCAFHQVHGTRVLLAEPGWFEEEADAAVTDDPELLLVVSGADCLPLLFHDPVRGAVGAAHAGWRGTAAGIAARVVEAMTAHFGSRPADLRVAIGPGILGDCYQVGPEVVAAFTEAGFPADVARPDAQADRFLLDLVAANRAVLSGAGVPLDRVRSVDRCTHCEPATFYSHRRDQGRTGRHWAFVALPRC